MNFDYIECDTGITFDFFKPVKPEPAIVATLGTGTNRKVKTIVVGIPEFKYKFSENEPWAIGTGGGVTFESSVPDTASQIFFDVPVIDTFSSITIESDAITEIVSWSDQSNLNGIRLQCSKLVKVPDRLFKSCTDTANMFKSCTIFNYDISNWDMSNVEDMYAMFSLARAFNQPIGNWNVSKVKNFSTIFYGANAFNQDLQNWQVGNGENFGSMFFNARAFNGNIVTWDMRKAKNCSSMFQNCSVFNQNIGSWQFLVLETANAMFYNASVFNQDLSNWNMATVTSRTNFDAGATAWTLPKPQGLLA